MTQLAFHFNAPGKVAYACKLLRKATATGARVAVLAPSALLGRLDQELWTFSPLDFVAHACAPCSPQAMAHSPVLLCDDLALLQGHSAGQGGYGVLVNLTDAVPDDLARFERVIEVVTADPTDRSGARQRWKHYVALGYDITRHDLQLAS
jgi:DNA polymerase III subunit chi